MFLSFPFVRGFIHYSNCPFLIFWGVSVFNHVTEEKGVSVFSSKGGVGVVSVFDAPTEEKGVSVIFHLRRILHCSK